MNNMSLGKIAAGLLVGVVAVAVLFGTADRTEKPAVHQMLDDFMQARLARNEGEARAFLTNQLHQTVTSSSGLSLVGTSNPHYHRYEVSDLTQLNRDTWHAEVRITEEISGNSDVGWFEERLTIKRIDGHFRIADLERGSYHNLPTGGGD